MYPLNVIHSLNEKASIRKDNFNRDSSLCQSRGGYVIHSGIHRSTAFIYTPETSYDSGEAWQALTYWKGQGQAAINGFIEAIIDEASLDTAELTAISRKRPEWAFTSVKYCGECYTATRRLAGFETRVSASSWQLLNDKLG